MEKALADLVVCGNTVGKADGGRRPEAIRQARLISS
jgi:hypothetical protein